MYPSHVNSLALALQASTQPSNFLMAQAGAALSSAAFRYLSVPEKVSALVKRWETSCRWVVRAKFAHLGL